MLARNVGRRQRHHIARVLDASFAQLTLPWLAPAQLRWSASQAAAASQTTPRTRKRLSSQPPQTAAQTRQLATATDQYVPRYQGQYPPLGYSGAFRNASQDDNIPWDGSKASRTGLSNLRPYDDPIMLKFDQNPEPMIKVSDGIYGNALELLQHLHTAVQTGRLSSAEAIIRRMHEICSEGSAELLHAHTVYLDECRRRLALHGRDANGFAVLQDMQKWFEVEVRNTGVAVDAKLLVVMVRASIRALSGSQRERTVRRYTEMAQELDDEQYIEVLESEDYDDNEYTVLNHLMEKLEVQDNAEQVEAQTIEPTQFRRNDILAVEELPEVLPTEQRGEGLANVKKTMQDFVSNPSLPAETAVDKQHEQAMNRQKVLEENSVDVALDRWRKADEDLRKIGIHTAMQSRPIGALMWQWHQTLVPALKAELEAWKATQADLSAKKRKQSDERAHYGPYLELLPLEKLAANTILFVLNRMHNGKNRSTGTYDTDVKLSHLTVGLARAIELEHKVNHSKDRSQRLRERRKGRSNQDRQSQAKLSKKKKVSRSEKERQALLEKLGWPLDTQVKLGSFLIAKLMESAHLPVTRKHPRTGEKVTQMQPAFLHSTKYEKGKKVGFITANPALVEKLESEPLGSVIAKRMPMVVEPKPWKSWSEGAYLHYPTPVLRLPHGDRTGKDYFLAAHEKGDMNQIYAGLTSLGAVPWKIHHGVFKVQLDAWNSGEEVANFAPLHPTFDLPREPEETNTADRHRWLLQVRDIENKRAGLHSKRCFQNFQLEVARAMVNETLYFPHNMDFRGRAYPVPPYLNHMGADNVRGLLVFANGKKLGQEGLRWLKIHLATVAGHDKASLAERMEFTMSHLNDIYDSVRNPLTGRGWWRQAEDAWQTLAACFELTEALDSANPAEFVSHLPIQQDGTCNGLQHYAALGGDEAGAAQVNLQPSDRPADVYTAVAEAVKGEVRQDAANGNAIAKILDGRLTRKCVKQPVMTNVYGVTWYGAREQVSRQLEVIFPEIKKYDDMSLSKLSNYVATKIFKSLGEMFSGAQAIQNWLGVCADRISTCITAHQVSELIASNGQVVEQARGLGRLRKPRQKRKPGTSEPAKTRKSITDLTKPLFKSTVVWTTPLRLPVVQPYRVAESRRVSTNLQQIIVQDPKAWHPVSKRKQLQAFPPNFIHSLDATHMLLSALKCKELGMTFASIHDSFWTHACDVDQLSQVLRDAFIEMHKDNIVGRLREEFQTRYEGCMHLASVVANSEAGKEITKLRQDQKLKQGPTELALEVERLQLLKSDNAEERARGEAMVTPGSILENTGNDATLVTSVEIGSQTLGEILDETQNPDSVKTNADVLAANGESEAVMETSSENGVDPITSSDDMKRRGHGPSVQPIKQTTVPRKIYVWRPLTFPPIPPRGSFDVRKIRESAYFFH